MIKVGIVDDHDLILHGLSHMLSHQNLCTVVFQASTGEETYNKLQEIPIDVLLLDIELPDTNGVELCGKLLKSFPTLKIIALTNHDETMWVRKMLRAGALGYLLKGTDKGNLLQAISTVFEGQQFLDPQVQNAILQQTLSGRKNSIEVKLTKRETEILALIANEYSNQEIADKLFLSIRTVEAHRNSLNQKLDIKNTAGLVKEALLRGLIS